MPSRPNEIGSKSRPRPTDGKKISKASNGVSQALWRGNSDRIVERNSNPRDVRRRQQRLIRTFGARDKGT